MGVNPKIGVPGYPKMDGENKGKNPIKMDDLGVPLYGTKEILMEMRFAMFVSRWAHYSGK